jgi:hypothetical protein
LQGPHGLGLDRLDADIRSAGGNVLVAALLGLQRDLGLEHPPGHLSPLCDDGQRGAADIINLGRLQDARNKTFAPIKELLYDEVIVHGVPHPNDSIPSVATLPTSVAQIAVWL